MSWQPLHWRWRQCSARRPATQVQEITQKQNKWRKRKTTHDSPRQRKVNSSRQKRIWDLLRHIPTFATRFLRLVAFVIFLLPAFVVFVWHYVTCDRVAVYYGDRHRRIDERHTEDDNERYVSSGVGNRGKRQKRKDPLFSRHYLDIYGSRTPPPSKASAGAAANKKPVVVFLTGGAWIIGYRMWGTLLGRALAPFGVLCIVPDYRNFPRVNIEGMVRDVDMSIQWAMDHVEEYGGDREKIVLVGQSAGAHIGGVVVAMKVWDWLRKERIAKESIVKTEGSAVAKNVPNEPVVDVSPLISTYAPHQLAFISTSSPDNLVTMRPVLHHHGLSTSVQRSIFGGLKDNENMMGEEEDIFEKWSPFHLVIKCHEEHLKLLEVEDKRSHDDRRQFKDVFPRMCVIHGTADNTVPISEAKAFMSLLSKLQIPVESRMYEGWSHTDPILEAPMCGDHRYHRDIYEMVCMWTGGGKNDERKQAELFDERHPLLQPICPTVLVEAARFCNPF